MAKIAFQKTVSKISHKKIEHCLTNMFEIFIPIFSTYKNRFEIFKRNISKFSYEEFQKFLTKNFKIFLWKISTISDEKFQNFLTKKFQNYSYEFSDKIAFFKVWFYVTKTNQVVGMSTKY